MVCERCEKIETVLIGYVKSFGLTDDARKFFFRDMTTEDSGNSHKNLKAVFDPKCLSNILPDE